MTQSGRINPTPILKEALRKKDRNQKTLIASDNTEFNLGGIDYIEVQRRRKEGECLQCAWPSDRKGALWVKNCRRTIKLDKGTANLPKAKDYQKQKEILQRKELEETSSEESSDDSL
jgi:hypothetical protein